MDARQLDRPRGPDYSGRRQRHSPPPGREALSIEEAAAAVGIGRATMYALLAAGEGPPTFRIGRRRLIRLESLRSWLELREATP